MHFQLRNKCAMAVAAVSLGLTLAAVPATAAELTIKRDSYGTPHIYADDTYGLFYGYGYAIAQDRLYQMEIAKRSTQGRVAEVLGKDYIDFDRRIRQHYSPDSIHQQLAQLSKADRDILEGYASGINQWLKKIEQQPEQLMPKQFLDNDFKPQPWTSFDVAMVFIGSMINRFGDFNTELQNQQLLDGLIAKHGDSLGRALFDQLVSIDNPEAPTTVPKGEWNPKLRAGAYKPGNDTTVQATNNTLPQLASLGGTLQLPDVKEQPFSNIIVLGAEKSKNARAILINGPQFGYYHPAYTYSIGLHGAGFEAVGNSPFGYPMVEFGYNQQISWGSTWGAGDNVDIYRLELNPDNPEQYRYKGQYQAFEKRTETIRVKDADSVEVTMYRSVHGPVIQHQPDKAVAYAKKRGWEGQEVATLLAWNKVGKAQNHAQWQAQVQNSAINVNWYYADKDGNIGYALGGRYPVRTAGHDHRLPVSGSGDYDWQGFMPFASNPQVYNPSTGFIANWNNRPAEGFPNPDQWWYSWNAADRVEVLFDKLNAQPRFTAEEAWQLMMDASFEDPNARFFVPRLLKAIEGTTNPRLQQAAQQLANWDYMDLDQDRDGNYDHPATAIFRHWLKQMLALSLQELLPAQQAPWFLGTGHPAAGSSIGGSINLEVGTKVVHQAIRRKESGKTGAFNLFENRDINAVMTQALKLAVKELTTDQGPELGNWRAGVAHTTYSHKNFLKIPQAHESEEMRNHLAMNRGTENNMTVFTFEGVIGYEVAAPGQSAFIAQDGTRSPHFDDQLELFGKLGKKRTWLSPDDVETNSADTTTLSY